MLEREDLPLDQRLENVLLMYLITFYCQEVIANNPRDGTKYLAGVTSRRL